MIYLQILMASAVLLLLMVVLMFFKNRKLKQEINVLKKVLDVKDATIANFQASRVAVKDVIENLSSYEEVMALVDTGESRADISEKLGIPVNKIELIIKFDKINKEKHI